MKIDQTAAQLYTLRDHLKTPADVAASLPKVRALGYTSVQVSGMGPIPEAELLKLCRDNGLSICATHEPGAQILQHPEQVCERLHALECRYTAYPFPAGVDLADESSVRLLIEGLNRSGEVLHRAGLTLCYHNHQHEFRKIGGKTIFEMIFAGTDPRYLQGEPDTYWVQYGGADPIDWCQRLHGRLPLLHLKDFRVNDESAPEYTHVGGGNLRWKEIVAAAEISGCQWYIVEQDTTPGDPFEALGQSYRYIAEHLCQ